MVSEADKGSRGRREFRITRTGRNELLKTDLYLEEALEEETGDLESVLRLACIAISEAKAKPARKLLLLAGEEHAKRSRRAKRRSTLPVKESSLAELYSAAMAHCDAIRRGATSKALESLVSILELDADRTPSARTRRKSIR
jgi:hypothetical protein